MADETKPQSETVPTKEAAKKELGFRGKIKQWYSQISDFFSSSLFQKNTEIPNLTPNQSKSLQETAKSFFVENNTDGEITSFEAAYKSLCMYATYFRAYEKRIHNTFRPIITPFTGAEELTRFFVVKVSDYLHRAKAKWDENPDFVKDLVEKFWVTEVSRPTLHFKDFTFATPMEIDTNLVTHEPTQSEGEPVVTKISVGTAITKYDAQYVTLGKSTGKRISTVTTNEPHSLQLSFDAIIDTGFMTGGMHITPDQPTSYISLYVKKYDKNLKEVTIDSGIKDQDITFKVEDGFDSSFGDNLMILQIKNDQIKTINERICFKVQNVRFSSPLDFEPDKEQLAQIDVELNKHLNSGQAEFIDATVSKTTQNEKGHTSLNSEKGDFATNRNIKLNALRKELNQGYQPKQLDNQAVIAAFVFEKFIKLRKERLLNPELYDQENRPLNTVATPLEQRSTYSIVVHTGNEYQKLLIPSQLLDGDFSSFLDFFKMKMGFYGSDKAAPKHGFDTLHQYIHKRRQEGHQGNRTYQSLTDQRLDESDPTAGDLKIVISPDTFSPTQTSLTHSIPLDIRDVFRDPRMDTYGVGFQSSYCFFTDQNGKLTDEVTSKTTHPMIDGRESDQEDWRIWETILSNPEKYFLSSSSEVLITPPEVYERRKNADELNEKKTSLFKRLKTKWRDAFFPEKRQPKEDLQDEYILRAVVSESNYLDYCLNHGIFDYYKNELGVKIPINSLLCMSSLIEANRLLGAGPGGMPSAHFLERTLSGQLAPALQLLPQELITKIQARKIEDFSLADIHCLLQSFGMLNSDRESLKKKNRGGIVPNFALMVGNLRQPLQFLGKILNPYVTYPMSSSGLVSATVNSLNEKIIKSYRTSHSRQEEFTTARQDGTYDWFIGLARISLNEISCSIRIKKDLFKLTGDIEQIESDFSHNITETSQFLIDLLIRGIVLFEAEPEQHLSFPFGDLTDIGISELKDGSQLSLGMSKLPADKVERFYQSKVYTRDETPFVDAVESNSASNVGRRGRNARLSWQQS